MSAIDTENIIDFDIHGFVGVRLFNPSCKDVETVAKQLGPLQKSLDRDPDIVIRFVSELQTPGLHYLGPKKLGYNEDEFFILRSSKRDAKVAVSLGQVGGRIEFVCQSGLKSVPSLLAVLNLTLLKKNVLALHASAFNYKGTGIVVTGWAKGGKTEALLSFAAHGAEYVGDEWIYLTADGQSMYGIPENIRLWDWHLENMPHLKKHLGFEKKALFSCIHGLDRLQNMLPANGIGRTMPVKFLREAMPALKRQLNVQWAPSVIFERLAKGFSSTPDKVFLMLSHESTDYTVNAVAPLEIAKRMVASLQFELMPFLESYYPFKFAFPDKANLFIENAAEQQLALLSKALEGKETYAVGHPYPLSFEKLYEVMQPFCEGQLNGKDCKNGSREAAPGQSELARTEAQ